MTGPLLTVTPTLGTHAVNKTYSDTLATSAFRTAGGVEATTVSWDTVVGPGLYQKLMHGTQNPAGPGIAGYYYVQVYEYTTSGSITQYAIPYISTNPVAYRHRYTGTWGAWQTLATGGDVAGMLPLAGGTLSGKLHVNTGLGIALQNPGNSLVSIGAQLVGGIHALEVTNGADANSGAYAPVQIGTPINGSSAARVDWVQGNFSADTHVHTRLGAGYSLMLVSLGSLAADTAYGPYTVNHGLGQTPGLVLCSAYADDNTHSIVGSVGAWTATQVTFTARNMGNNAETCSMGLVAFK